MQEEAVLGVFIYIFQHDMTVEELYGAISNEIDSIYANG